MTQNRTQQSVAEYVVGYCFSPDMGQVALIMKAKPAWQAGKLNGAGGKVEPGETAHQAMAREFDEEAGVQILQWLHIRTEQFYAEQEATREQPTGARVHHFAAIAPNWGEWARIDTQEAEPIVKVPYPLREYTQHKYIYNLPYLIPMAAVLLNQPPENRPVP